MDENHKLFMNDLTWNSCNFSMEIQSNDNCFFNPNWDNSMDQSYPFESALSSIVTSPEASNASMIPLPPLRHSTAGDNGMIRELIGRLGNICNSGEISAKSYLQQSHCNSTNTSCYSTDLNSPPKLHLSTMDSHIRGNLPIPGLTADPGFAERAARLSCFGARNGLSEIEVSHKLITRPESGKISRVSNTQSMKIAAGSHQQNKKSDGNSDSNKKFNRLSRSSTPENGELGDSKEESSVSEQISVAQNDVNGRKRKSLPRGKSKPKETTTPSSSPSTNDTKVVLKTEESNPKRSKQNENDGNQKQNKDNSKPPEPPKDYIHVRARRGQATDSHSLAERVRREKISERMKFLQDLVPGCNKVTGKAVMLDEIINYVQSLQRQVEFLSMKLATVNPRMDFNVEALLSKDMYQSRGSVYPMPVNSSTKTLFPFVYQEQTGIPLTSETRLFSVNNDPLNSSLHRNQNQQLPPPSINGGGYTEAASHVPSLWEDDLQNLVQMGFNQNQPQSFSGGSIATAQTEMKIEM